MLRLIYSLVIIIGSLVVGQFIHVKTKNLSEEKRVKSDKIISILRNIAFFGLAPFVSFNAFWIVDLKNISIIAVPLIGIGALVMGSLFALLFAKLFKHEKNERGAMFCCGSSSNIGIIGALICFALFGEVGFAFCALYKFFELPYYYLIVYPVAKTFSENRSGKSDRWYLKLIKDPIIIVYFSSIVLGLIFNALNIPRSNIFEIINSVFIPLSSLLLIVAIGYTMRFSKIANYKKEVLSISAIKYLLTPLIVISLSLLLGHDKIADGVLFKTLVILSALPCGFNSLIPVQMYKLNINLANSCWIVTTALLSFVVPIIWVIIR